MQGADVVSYDVDIAKSGDDALDKVLHDTATLISLRSSPVGPFGLVARANADLSRFTAALQGLGYYKGSVAITVNGIPLAEERLADALDQVPAKQVVKVAVSVDHGPLYHLGRVTIAGSVPADAEQAMDLHAGQPAVAAAVIAGRGRLESALASDSYALAKVGEPDAVLHNDQNLMDVTFPVTTGPRVNLGPVTVTGLKDTNPDYVKQRLLVHQGEAFNPTRIEQARQDLVNTGIFGVARATPAASLDANGALPLNFTVEERPRHAVTFTAGYSTDLGASVGATWQYRNVFGNGEQINLSAAVNGGGTAQNAPGYNVGAQFVRPDLFRRDLSMTVDLDGIKESLEAYDRTAVTGDVIFSQKLSKEWTVSAGVSGEQEHVLQEGVSRDYTLVGLPLGARYDSTNDLFNPSRGIRANASIEPTESLSGKNAAFVLTQVSASTYLDLSALWGRDGRSIIALRALAGDAEGASQFELPPDKRFYAGGSGTVRGYKYQSVGPRFADNNPEGGTAVAAATVEFRQRILERFGAVAFVDGGQVAAKGAPFTGNWMLGAGVGARYYTSFGPIRVDIAVPLDKRQGDDTLELYIGIGQAF